MSEEKIEYNNESLPVAYTFTTVKKSDFYQDGPWGREKKGEREKINKEEKKERGR